MSGAGSAFLTYVALQGPLPNGPICARPRLPAAGARRLQGAARANTAEVPPSRRRGKSPGGSSLGTRNGAAAPLQCRIRGEGPAEVPSSRGTHGEEEQQEV